MHALDAIDLLDFIGSYIYFELRPTQLGIYIRLYTHLAPLLQLCISIKDI